MISPIPLNQFLGIPDYTFVGKRAIKFLCAKLTVKLFNRAQTLQMRQPKSSEKGDHLCETENVIQIRFFWRPVADMNREALLALSSYTYPNSARKEVLSNGIVYLLVFTSRKTLKKQVDIIQFVWCRLDKEWMHELLCKEFPARQKYI